MSIAQKVFISTEKRLDYERRQFSFTFHIPERRASKDRRRVNGYQAALRLTERDLKPVLVQPSR
ncbi:MAG: hypothetical protein KKF30_17295 [Proteobacteria bacterium]|nr:hypothetical protein [Pseudomonadota bacterium]MBU4469135.1 hypothetical protein [Pseudomonadota bacterium]MCG2752167.1 hypothetical protein [Desulfobacteraceae bacterium]